jgi:hypothetical protein
MVREVFDRREYLASQLSRGYQHDAAWTLRLSHIPHLLLYLECLKWRYEVREGLSRACRRRKHKVLSVEQPRYGGLLHRHGLGETERGKGIGDFCNDSELVETRKRTGLAC